MDRVEPALLAQLEQVLVQFEAAVVVEVRHIGQLVGIGQGGDDALIDLVADVRLALERD